jgi:hypothetical protein
MGLCRRRTGRRPSCSSACSGRHWRLDEGGLATGGTKGPHRCGSTRATGADHHQYVGAASGEPVEDVAEREKLETTFAPTFGGV